MKKQDSIDGKHIILDIEVNSWSHFIFEIGNIFWMFYLLFIFYTMDNSLHRHRYHMSDNLPCFLFKMSLKSSRSVILSFISLISVGKNMSCTIIIIWRTKLRYLLNSTREALKDWISTFSNNLTTLSTKVSYLHFVWQSTLFP